MNFICVLWFSDFFRFYWNIFFWNSTSLDNSQRIFLFYVGPTNSVKIKKPIHLQLKMQWFIIQMMFKVVFNLKVSNRNNFLVIYSTECLFLIYKNCLFILLLIKVSLTYYVKKFVKTLKNSICIIIRTCARNASSKL